MNLDISDQQHIIDIESGWLDYARFVRSKSGIHGKSVRDSLLYGAVSAAGEAGELLNLVKKMHFHALEFNDELRERLIEEAGDVLWSLQFFALYMGVGLDEIRDFNVRKLQRRYPDGYTREAFLAKEAANDSARSAGTG